MPAPEFAVASIKRVERDSSIRSSRWPPGGAVDLHYVTVKELMGNSWHIFPPQILGAPAWTRTAAYDISPKPDTAAKPGEVNLMLQALLRTRFGRSVHHEKRNLPIYALVMARKDGTLGPSLVESKDGGCAVRIPGVILSHRPTPRNLPRAGAAS